MKEKLKNKILLISPDAPGIIVAPPLGLGFLASSLMQNGYSVEIIDMAIDNFNMEKLVKKIKNEKIEIIGFTTITPAVNSVIVIIDFIKKHLPWLKIIIGGPHASILPLETFNLSRNIDFLVIGEGEKVILKIVDFITEKGNLKDVSGIIYRENGKKVFKEGSNFLNNLDEVPISARELMKFYRYSNLMFSFKKPVTSMIISRGCPYQCIYCSKPVTGSKVRERSVESVIKEIGFLKKHFDLNELVFYDDVFTFNKHKVITLCEEIIKNKFNIIWKCETRVNLVDEDLLKLMKKAGCYLIAYGIEAGTQKILDYLKKGITLEQARNAINLTKKSGIKTQGYFMIGVPTENEKDIIQTIEFAKSLPLDICQFSIATPYPGTELFEIAKERGLVFDSSRLIYSASKLNEIISLCDLSPILLRKLLKKAYREFYFRPYFIMRNLKTLNYPNLKYILSGFKHLVRAIS